MSSERSTSTMKSDPGRSMVLSRPAPLDRPPDFAAGLSAAGACAVTVLAGRVAAAPFRKERRASFFMESLPGLFCYGTQHKETKHHGSHHSRVPVRIRGAAIVRS